MNILFITSNRIGDAVLSTGLLDRIAHDYPAAAVTIVCGGLPASLFEGYPNLKEIIVLKKQSYNRHWLKLWQKVAGTKWDMVVDLRDSIVSRLVGARQRYIYSKRIDKTKHKVEQAAAVMKLDTVPAPRLWFTDAQKEQAEELIPQGVTAVLGVGPTANWIGKTWPADRFIETIKILIAANGILPGARVAVFAAPGEEEDARKVLASIPEARQIDVIAKTTPGMAAAALARCDMFLGNDSGLTHCAAAVGTPTVALFGPSYDHLYRPWGEHCTFVRTPETFDELIDFPGYNPKTLDHTLMEGLSVKSVLHEIDRFWNRKEAA
ncbi:MAG: glycosyltransferase family 9 protein [Rhodospirillales bacterium]|nr:glycosyltransferase family 9 protein [Rhodospirillales bacterium]